MTVNKNIIILFLNGFSITFLSNVNIFHVQHSIYTGIIVLGFVIPFLSVSILKSLVFGDMKTKIFYCIGVSLGGFFGLLFAKFLYKL